MSLRSFIVVALALAAALVVLVVGGLRVLERDREALFGRYAHERVQEAEETAHGLAAALSDIGEDLGLAATLLDHAESQKVAERELHAIATIKRAYQAMDARTEAGDVTSVIALDAPAGVAQLAKANLAQALDAAGRAPDTLHVSAPLGAELPASRYRVFARRSHGVTIAVVVDVSVLLDRLVLPRSVSAVFGPDGAAAPIGEPALARAPRSPLPTARIDAAHAATLGLPAAPAVAISLPIIVDASVPWQLVVVSSTRPLEEQEATIVRRVLAVSGLVLVLLVIAAAYVVHNARRASTLRERLRNADRLAHLTERAEKIVDHIPSGVLMLSDDRRITGANRWFAERFGHDAVGGELAAVFSSADVAVVTALVDQAVSARQARSLHRVQLALFGEDAWINIHAVPLERRIADVSTLVVFEDLTQLRRIEERLLHSEKLVTAGQLAAGIAHEIGTPLNVARGRVELALRHLGDDHAEARNHELAIDQIDRVTRLIQQLLDYVRPVPEAMQQVDAAAAIDAVRELLASRAEKQRVSIEAPPPGEHAVIHADPDQVQQVLVNLVLNAIDACSPGGRVAITLGRNPTGVVIEVRDDGHGIPRDAQAQVFDPFFTTKKRGQGTGLGLWVVAQIVRAHSAEIELDSAPGAGTTVRVTWPVPA